jgi:glutathione S-transferase
MPNEVRDLMNKYEAKLSRGQFIGGNALSGADRDAYSELQPYANYIVAKTHPYLFGWYAFVAKFTENM